MKLTIKVNKTDTDKFELISTDGKVPELITLIDRSAFRGTQLDNDIEEAFDYGAEVQIKIEVVK